MNAAETGTAVPNGVHPTATPPNQPETDPKTSTALPTVYVAPPPTTDATASVPFVESPPVVSAPEPNILHVEEDHVVEDSSRVESLPQPVDQETRNTSQAEPNSAPDAPDDEINDLD